MADSSSERYVRLNRLADEFAERYRAGEQPQLQEYCDRHPELADEIREFFPAMAEIEKVKDEVQAPVVGAPPLRLCRQRALFRHHEIGWSGSRLEAPGPRFGPPLSRGMGPSPPSQCQWSLARPRRVARDAVFLWNPRLQASGGTRCNDGQARWTGGILGRGVDRFVHLVGQSDAGGGDHIDAWRCINLVGRVHGHGQVQADRTSRCPHECRRAAKLARGNGAVSERTVDRLRRPRRNDAPCVPELAAIQQHRPLEPD